MYENLNEQEIVEDINLFAEEDDLFFEELDERYNAVALSTLSTASSAGCICTVGTICTIYDL